MKDSDLAEQEHCDPASFAFGDLGAKLGKQCLDAAPFDVGTRGAREHQFKRAPIRALHVQMVPDTSTTARACKRRWQLPKKGNVVAQKRLSCCGSGAWPAADCATLGAAATIDDAQRSCQ